MTHDRRINTHIEDEGIFGILGELHETDRFPLSLLPGVKVRSHCQELPLSIQFASTPGGSGCEDTGPHMPLFSSKRFTATRRQCA